MSSTSLPISPARFSAALPSLPLASLHNKAAEIHNSIAHLQSSNAQLAPFTIRLLATSTDTAQDRDGPDSGDQSYDPDCATAVQENDELIERMRERLGLLKNEVEKRGAIWVWGALDELAAGKSLEKDEDATLNGEGGVGSSAAEEAISGGPMGMNGGHGMENWQGQGDRAGAEDIVSRTGDSSRMEPAVQRNGRLTDEELQRRMRAQLDDMEDDGTGLHL